ncbi:MAG: hypothetical protein LBD58_09915 [Treponema sp.]|nr:hypothetical protein [Treponema sp.]
MFDYFRLYENCFNCTFNEITRKGGLSTAESTVFQQTLNNVPQESILRQAAYLDAKALFSLTEGKKVIFGGRKLFYQRQSGNISHDDYARRRTRPISVSGDSSKEGGHYVFKLLSSTEVLFKPNKDTKVLLTIKNDRKGNKKLLEDLVTALASGGVPVSYKLGPDFVSITFDVMKVKTVAKRKVVPNRVFAIDTNPNYLGWSVVDWKGHDDYTIVDSGVVSIKPLNDVHFGLKGAPPDDPRRVYLTNKRHYEITMITRDLVTLARHYGCDLFIFEDLNRVEGQEEGQELQSPLQQRLVS